MGQVDAHLTTGLAGLDRMLKGLIPGDNIVWLVESMAHYRPFLAPYCEAAARQGRRIVCFRFAGHPPLLADLPHVETHELDPSAGFEKFTGAVHRVIESNGRGAFYVFDCLSDLAETWFSDQMLANFFLLTCPYLLDMEAIAYFALRRSHHCSQATAPIAETAQVLLNVYEYDRRLYVQPIKVKQRYSPTMHMLHVMDGGEFRPVTDSATICEVLNATPWPMRNPPDHQLGVWNRTFLEAEDAVRAAERGQADPAAARDLLRRLLRMAISRDPRVLRLLEEHLTLADVLQVGRRMIGTGLIGGKSVGMLLARAILHERDPRWGRLLEPHDSFYIGSDVFYTYLVRNGIGWTNERHQDAAEVLRGAEWARQRVLLGAFPEAIERQLSEMLDYFGQSPIIVRSSSLLEDNFGNAFAGKYESVFCANQGPRHKRFEDLLTAIRTIYASAMSEKALTYRARRGLLGRDEQMALLVQRVSGSLHGELFFPHVAGVGLSFNPFAWSRDIDPKAGVLRLVFGLGTRAVDRSDDDYTRVVALNAPQLRPESNLDEVRQYSQRRVDVLDFEANQLVSKDFHEIVRQGPAIPLELFASRDTSLDSLTRERGRRSGCPWVLTFDELLRQTSFVSDMREMLETLQQAYDYPVDIEFAANFAPDGRYRINLLQCRPLQVKGTAAAVEPPPQLPVERMLLEARGAVIGEGQVETIDRIVYVRPDAYAQMPIAERYALARVIGQVMHLEPRPRTILLAGPGRWGTSTPSLGVPVSFADINTASILCEIVSMGEGVTPDVSLGTHFFSELVEMGVLYMALFPARPGNCLNRDLLEGTANRLARLLPAAARWEPCLRVIEPADLGPGRTIRLNANTLEQRVVVYLEPAAPSA